MLSPKTYSVCNILQREELAHLVSLSKIRDDFEYKEVTNYLCNYVENLGNSQPASALTSPVQSLVLEEKNDSVMQLFEESKKKYEHIMTHRCHPAKILDIMFRITRGSNKFDVMSEGVMEHFRS